MRAALIAAMLLGACATASAEWAHIDAVEPLLLEAGHGAPAACNADDIPVDAAEALARASACPPQAGDTETARARAYLVTTATPGYTMMRQGPALAIGRLHPAFARQLAAAIAEARKAGLQFAGIFSAYRPPAFGVGGFVDKFLSLHTYGLAVDITGIGAPGTSAALLWHEIAARHGVVCPYGPHNAAEWNHCQPTQVKMVLPQNPLRETVTADGPIMLDDMFEVGDALIAAPGRAGAPHADPPAHLFKPPPQRSAMAPAPRTAAATGPKTIRGATLAPVNRAVPASPPSPASARKLRLVVSKSGWPSGVPRIINLGDEPRRPNTPAASRAPPKPIVMPQVVASTR
jgi:hypothetical protein